MNLEVLTNDELLKLASYQDEHNDHIMKEWYKRNKINFPYTVVDGKVYNCILKEFIDEDRCDKLILKQYKKIIGI